MNNREIKFRCWDENDKIMDNVEFLTFPQPREEGKFRHLMQYTGLKDKNGKEIYEGDIIKFPQNPLPFVVQWNRYFLEMKTPNGIYNSGLGLHALIEVVGNIYENPELLQAKGGEE